MFTSIAAARAYYTLVSTTTL